MFDVDVEQVYFVHDFASFADSFTGVAIEITDGLVDFTARGVVARPIQT